MDRWTHKGGSLEFHSAMHLHAVILLMVKQTGNTSTNNSDQISMRISHYCWHEKHGIPMVRTVIVSTAIIITTITITMKQQRSAGAASKNVPPPGIKSDKQR